MALTQTKVSELYVAIFNRASEGQGNRFWQAETSPASAADAMLASNDARSYFGTSLDTNQAFIEHIYLNTLNKTATDDPTGIAYWVGLLNGGQTRGVVVAGLVDAINDTANAGPAQDLFNNRVAVSNHAANTLNTPPADYGRLLGFSQNLSIVTSDSATVGAANNIVDGYVNQGGGGTPGQTYYLTDAMDNVTGTADDDTFIARGNNTLTNHDIIDGGAGTDTIEVMLDNDETAESPLVTNVEILKVQGQSRIGDGNASGDGDNDVDTNSFVNLLNAGDIESNIDAGDMRSVKQYWSEDSRADVTIEDVSHNSHETIIGMRETDPGDVDFNVFFDPENITARGDATPGSTLVINAANVFNIAEAATKNLDVSPLEGFSVVSFNVGGKLVSVNLLDANNVQVVKTYSDLVSAIESALAAAGINDVSVSAQSEIEARFSIDINEYTAGSVAGTFNPILLTSTSGQLTKGSFTLSNSDVSGNLVQTQTNAVDDAAPALTSAMIILDRVGKNSEGGDLLVGSDSTGNSGSQGIEHLYVDVDRDSHLGEIASTNNWLEVINVRNIAQNSDGKGYLKVNDINDVRVFDASTMLGDVTLTANLSDKVTAKYLDQVDDDNNPATDNSQLKDYRDVVDNEFSYDFGLGNDTFTLNLNQTNLESAGTVSREDFVMEINGGAGNDKLTTLIGDGAGTDANNWYLNHKINADLTVNGGSGDDTITTLGAGDFIIDGGTGNDTIYTDNIGSEYVKVDDGADSVANSNAKWVVNTLDDSTGTNIYDMAGASAATQYLLGHVKLGVAVTAATGVSALLPTSVADALTNAFEARDYKFGTNVVSSLGINQAIKDVINNDPVLSKVLLAEDGTGNTLVISSLVDGLFEEQDLEITLTGPTVAEFNALSQSEKTALLNAARELKNDSTIVEGDLQTLLTTEATAATTDIFGLGDGDAVFATDGNAEITGASSTVATDNTINMSAGDDVIVLSTSALANEKLVFSGDFGNDSVFNFNDTGDVTTSSDTLDFTSYLNSMTSPSGSATSAQRIGTSLDTDTIVSENEVVVIDNFTASAGQTWAGLTGSQLLAALTGATTPWGSINSTDFSTNDLDANLVGATKTFKSVFLVENNANQGEYKVFDVTSTGGTTDEFTAVKLVGTVDFGADVNFTTATLA